MTRNQATTVLVAGGWVAAIGGAWLLSALWLARSARTTLRVHFLWRLQHPAAEALHIWAANSKATAGVALCILLVLFARRACPEGLHGLLRLPFLAADVLLAAMMLRIALLAGVLLGAYGSTQLRVFLPYGPVELAAWVTLSILYVNARTGRAGLCSITRGLLTVEMLLLAAAVLEVIS
jgi:hypothetical protein